MTESSRVGISYKGEQTNPLKQTQVKAETISNHKTKITITGIQKGDVIKVYPTNGAKQYSKQFKAASSKISFELPQKDTLYLSITNSGMLESGRIAVNIGE
ncbi:hypothetical protein [Niallia nealsonii]|uniref:Uncharacterized protein n=1 Tax=Niallia nealsonii TaxID=115979 RepID=A0A2N0Z5W0_9BACI|nr:hypothetical protein [Niallia nealsonii]PKG24883.1 hypothetical protein CWS01_04810 [Niallia nealsonii]